MYENIYLFNRVKSNGNLKKSNYSFFNNSLNFSIRYVNKNNWKNKEKYRQFYNSYDIIKVKDWNRI